MTPHLRLETGRKSTGRTRAALARELGVHKSFITLLMRGDKRPGLDLAARIERLTSAWPGGVIRAVEWAAAPEATRTAA